MQSWLASGKRVVRKFSMSQRIGHISKTSLKNTEDLKDDLPAPLATALPYPGLLDEVLTLEEADLRNAVIIQRLHKTTEYFGELSLH